MADKLVGASVWEEELYEHLTSHEDNEAALLMAYREAAASSQSPAFQYLVSLIIDDETRHHRLIGDIASALKTDAQLRPEQPAVPRLDHFGPDSARIVELTDQLLGQERADARKLHRLSRELKDLKDTTIWQLLVRLMEMDTAKHIEILEFVREHAKKQPR